MFCSQCGTELSEKSKFCHQCGKKFNFEKIAKSQSGVTRVISKNTVQKKIKQRYSNGESITHLVVFCLSTYYIYSIIWFNNNWGNLKRHYRSTIKPGWMTAGLFVPILNIFLIYDLFRDINKYAEKIGVKKHFSPLLLSLGFVLLNFFYLGFIVLIPVQKTLNEIWKKEQPDLKIRKKFSIPEIIWVCIAFILLICGIFGNALENKNIKSDNIEEDVSKNSANYFTNTSSWKEFNSTVSDFKVLFPGYPTHETENLLIPDTEITFKYDTYTNSVQDGTTYFVNTATYPSEVDVSNPEDNLEGALNGMVTSGASNRLISSSFTYFDGYRALDFLIQSEDIYLKGKIIMVNNTLYQIIVAYEDENYDEEYYNKFIDSFELL